MARIHPAVENSYFDQYPAERDLVRPLLPAFDVTWASRKRDGNAEIAAYFLKPEHFIAELLGTDREILFVYAPFAKLQARAILLHDSVAAQHSTRLDPVGSILVAPPTDTKRFVHAFLATQPERPPIVAFSLEELAALDSVNALRAALISQFFNRNLFAVESPLKSDTLFFGRTSVVAELLDRFRAGQSSGLFGLRRIGKTSVLYALGRRSVAGKLGGFAYVDTSNPSLHKSRWWGALQQLVQAIATPFALKRGERSHIRALTVEYDEGTAARHFKSDVENLIQRMPDQRLLLALDEIEHLTFGISPASHWADDSLPLWQTLRSVHQDTAGAFCFVVAGVNPHLLEAERIGRFDNPLFSTVRPYYLRPFDRESVREMVRRLARHMGLRCDEALYGALAEEYGGHPFLVRQACSQLARTVPERPGELTLTLLDGNRSGINRGLEKNVRQILNVLAIWYPDEYEMIRILAAGDVETFRSFAEASAEFTEHMEGYGLVENPTGAPRITMGLVEQVLKRKQPVGPRGGTDADAVLVEITTRRNKIEKKLRSVLRDGLRFGKGNKAAAAVLQALSDERRAQVARHSYDEVWQHLYFAELRSIVEKHWAAFQNWFVAQKADVLNQMAHINRSRADAHAREITEEDLSYLRVCFKRMEEHLDL